MGEAALRFSVDRIVWVRSSSSSTITYWWLTSSPPGSVRREAVQRSSTQVFQSSMASNRRACTSVTARSRALTLAAP